MEALVGNIFVDGAGKSYALKDIVKDSTKAVGLYFSAHWCPPCRQFTPMLAKFYKEDLKSKGLEIIFVSGDRDEASYNGYLKEMPWYGLPYSDRAREKKLSAKFKVQGIPSFIILTPNGDLITDGGRAAVMSDPKGANFPWTPRNPIEILNAGNYIGKDGKKRNFQELTKDLTAVALYFSASWCGPCHKFTPVLSDCYNALKKADADAKRPQRFEVIFISSDRDEGSFKKYFDSMPWSALSFDESELKESMEERYQIEGIPTLILLDPKTGATLNEECVPAVMSDPKGENFPWTPKPVELLDQATASKIGSSPSMFVFCESDEKAKEFQKDLTAAVDVWQGRSEEGAVCHGDVCIPTGGRVEGSEDVLFFVAGANPLVDRVREIAKAGGTTVAILDIPSTSYAHADIASLDKATPMALRKFLVGYLTGTVAKQNLR